MFSKKYSFTSYFEHPALAIVSAKIGESNTSGRSVPLAIPTVNINCHEICRTTASAIYGSNSSGVDPETETRTLPPV